MTLAEILRRERVYSNGCGVEDIKEAFKNWLREVGLPDYFASNRDGAPFNTTESIRQLLINLVDEP